MPEIENKHKGVKLSSKSRRVSLSGNIASTAHLALVVMNNKLGQLCFLELYSVSCLGIDEMHQD